MEIWPSYFEEHSHHKCPRKIKLKAAKHKSFRHINQFLSEIGKIPYRCGGYEKFITLTANDSKLKMEQEQIYRKWMNFAERIHRRKWMRYLKLKTNADIKNMENGIWYKPFWTLNEFENAEYDDYGIPNIDNLLTIPILNEMTKILLSDGVLGIQCLQMKHVNASRFEDFVFDAIGTVFGDREDAVMMNEHDVRQSGSCEVSPDVLFSSSVNINGVDIYWMDMKHYYVTSREPITFKKIGPQIGAYLKEFGNGAILCCGYQSSFVQKLKAMFPKLKGEILMLDCSSWYPFAKDSDQQ